MQKNLKVNFNRQSAREAFVQNTQQTSQPLDLAEVCEGLANKKEVHVQHPELWYSDATIFNPFLFASYLRLDKRKDDQVEG